MTREKLRPLLLVAVLLIGFGLGVGAGWGHTRAIERAEQREALTAQANERRWGMLFQGRCNEAKCAVKWEEMSRGSSESNLGRRNFTTLYAPGPIACPMKNEIPWVAADLVTGGVDFICALPDGGSQ